MIKFDIMIMLCFYVMPPIRSVNRLGLTFTANNYIIELQAKRSKRRVA